MFMQMLGDVGDAVSPVGELVVIAGGWLTRAKQQACR